MGFLKQLSLRNRNWLLIAVVVVMIVLLQLSPPPTRTPTAYFDGQMPRVIAHQGGNLLRPGNTLASFDYAAALGVDVLEMDVHLSADGHLVVIHDATVQRTTDGQGAVQDMTLAQLQALDAGYRWQDRANAIGHPDEHPFRGQGFRIPALATVLERYPLPLVIELKPEDASAAHALCDALQARSRTTDVLVASFHDAAIKAFREACPQVATSASADEVAWFLRVYALGLERMFRVPVLALQLPHERDGETLMTPELVAAAGRWDVQVEFWTLNEVEAMRTAIQSGAAGIMTDRPDLLLDELGRL